MARRRVTPGHGYDIDLLCVCFRFSFRTLHMRKRGRLLPNSGVEKHGHGIRSYIYSLGKCDVTPARFFKQLQGLQLVLRLECYDEQRQSLPIHSYS